MPWITIIHHQGQEIIILNIVPYWKTNHLIKCQTIEDNPRKILKELVNYQGQLHIKHLQHKIGGVGQRLESKKNSITVTTPILDLQLINMPINKLNWKSQYQDLVLEVLKE